jgi:spore germination protein GerM
MKKQIVLSLVILFAVALFAPAVSYAFQSENVVTIVDNKEKKEVKQEASKSETSQATTEKKAETTSEKKACCDKEKAGCSESKVSDTKSCTGEKKACCDSKKKE